MKKWTLDEIRELYELPVLELVRRAAQVHAENHSHTEVQLCEIVNIKQGGCSEDCKYCPQSARYKTHVKATPMMEPEAVLERAREAKKNGITRMCLGAAWRQVRDSKQFDKVVEMVKGITDLGVECCCTLGMLSQGQIDRLKEAGLYAYNHNLDSSQNFYDTIITTRSYQERLDTLERVAKAGVSICCGGILGMGETKEDRLQLLQTLANHDPQPESVPINKLAPFQGTPLGQAEELSFWEYLPIVALARILLPKAMVRLSAGRRTFSDAEQALCFLAGANSIHTGGKLLTSPTPELNADAALLDKLQLAPREPFKDEKSAQPALATT